MKILTLNTHSWQEDNQLEKLDILAKAIIEQEIDILALQEVNQHRDSDKLLIDIGANIEVRSSNFGFLLQHKLAMLGTGYALSWDYVHQSYDLYHEGLSFLTRVPIQQKEVIDLSDHYDEGFWKHRRAVKVTLSIDNQEIDFINCHCGWWDDHDAPFQLQIDKIKAKCSDRLTFLLGDFNSHSGDRDQGYDYVLSQGFMDTYSLAQEKDSGETVVKMIDGWEFNQHKLRIDYVFVNQEVKVNKHHTIFNGEDYPVISDHFGVCVELTW